MEIHTYWEEEHCERQPNGWDKRSRTVTTSIVRFCAQDVHWHIYAPMVGEVTIGWQTPSELEPSTLARRKVQRYEDWTLVVRRPELSECPEPLRRDPTLWISPFAAIEALFATRGRLLLAQQGLFESGDEVPGPF